MVTLSRIVMALLLLNIDGGYFKFLSKEGQWVWPRLEGGGGGGGVTNFKLKQVTF